MTRLIDETDNRHGRLLVLERFEESECGAAQWICECDCGEVVVVDGRSLRKGNTRSCGCLKRDIHTLPMGNASFNMLLARMEARAERRGLDWQITVSQVRLFTKQPCHYCGAEPSQVARTHNSNGAYIYSGLDRIDNDRGYVDGNVVPCCSVCNYAKRSMTVKEFYAWIERVHTHHQQMQEENDE